MVDVLITAFLGVTYIQRGASQSRLLCIPRPPPRMVEVCSISPPRQNTMTCNSGQMSLRLITGSWQSRRHWRQGRRAVKCANSCSKFSSIGPLCLYGIVCGQCRQPNTIIDAESTSAQSDKLCWVIRHGNDARNDTALPPVTCLKPLRDRGLPLGYNCENIVIQ